MQILFSLLLSVVCSYTAYTQHHRNSIRVRKNPVRKITDKIYRQMLLVEGGVITLGNAIDKTVDQDENGLRTDSLGAFMINKYELTQLEWTAIMGSNPSFFKNCLSCPVENISWNDAMAFIAKLNQYTGKEYRLPTEAEWEFAASGGTDSKGYKYAGSNAIDSVAWYWKNSGHKYLNDTWSGALMRSNKNRPQRVGRKKANELGLFDMSGNVWEWCSSNYTSNYRSTTPTGEKVLRGGGYAFGNNDCRVKNRYKNIPEKGNKSIGMRLVLSVSEE